MKSTFVLWCDGMDFYVSMRISSKKACNEKEHFIGFFETEKAAWKYAIERTDQRIKMLNGYKKRFKKSMF